MAYRTEINSLIPQDWIPELDTLSDETGIDPDRLLEIVAGHSQPSTHEVEELVQKINWRRHAAGLAHIDGEMVRFLWAESPRNGAVNGKVDIEGPQEWAALILPETCSLPLKEACSEMGFSRNTVYQWFKDDFSRPQETTRRRVTSMINEFRDQWGVERLSQEQVFRPIDRYQRKQRQNQG